MDRSKDRLYHRVQLSTRGASWMLLALDVPSGGSVSQDASPLTGVYSVLNVDAQGAIYGFSWDTAKQIEGVFEIDPANGNETKVGQIAGLQSLIASANAIDRDSWRIYQIGKGASDQWRLYVFDLKTMTTVGDAPISRSASNLFVAVY